MIRRLTSDLPSFKSLSFGPGLNILLAEKSEGAGTRHSRNAAGKSSFVELVHFLYGAKAKPDGLFRCDELRQFAFTADILLGGRNTRVTRSGETPNAVRVQVEKDAPEEILSTSDRSEADRSLTLAQWSALLGSICFDLPPPEDGEPARYSPTFRSLFSYFARRQGSGGFIAPTRQSAKQQLFDEQVAISHLLGLDPRLSQELHEVRQKEKTMAQLRQAAKDGHLEAYTGTSADLRTRLTLAEERERRQREHLSNFNVVPEYEGFEKEASALTRTISGLNDDNTVDRELLSQLTQAIEAERPPVPRDLERLYEEAGVVLPGTVERRFDEVAAFHQAVMKNRRAHLDAEIGAATARIRQRNAERIELDVRRRELLLILDSGGALEHYTRIREEVGRASAEIEGLRQRLRTAEQIESTKTELEIERSRLLLALRADVHERQALLDEAILIFASLSGELYEQPGSLTIEPTANGPKFDVRIDAQLSKGISNMQIFCFDLMLVTLVTRRGLGPGFLIHDSHLFDGVDERQVARALQLGARHATSIGFQYIVTMNSDAFPGEGFEDKFDLRDHVIEPTLTDASETGGLFGFRFG